MLTLKELCIYLDRLLIPAFKCDDYCPNGLQVEGHAKINKVATAVSANLETIEKAAELGIDALIVHHGLFWQKDSYVIQGAKKKKLEILLKQGMSLLAYHLPLDMHQEVGNNWRAAREMGWSHLQPFGFFNGVPIGVKGEVHLSQEGLKAQLEEYYQHAAIMAPGGPKAIKSVGLISGGAYKGIADAAVEGLDAFITGNFDEPAWSQAFEEKVNFYAMGHSATERVGPRALNEQLKADLGINSQFLDIPNPF